MAKHKIVILTGPGGVGKTTISQFLCQNLSEEFRETVSCTTRSKREMLCSKALNLRNNLYSRFKLPRLYYSTVSAITSFQKPQRSPLRLRF